MILYYFYNTDILIPCTRARIQTNALLVNYNFPFIFYLIYDLSYMITDQNHFTS